MEGGSAWPDGIGQKHREDDPGLALWDQFSHLWKQAQLSLPPGTWSVLMARVPSSLVTQLPQTPGGGCRTPPSLENHSLAPMQRLQSLDGQVQWHREAVLLALSRKLHGFQDTNTLVAGDPDGPSAAGTAKMQ